MCDQDTTHYASERNKIRKRIVALRYALISLVVVLLSFIYLGELSQSFVMIFIAWFFFFAFSFARVFFSVCPKCGAMIYMRGALSLRVQSCSNCSFSFRN